MLNSFMYPYHFLNGSWLTHLGIRCGSATLGERLQSLIRRSEELSEGHARQLDLDIDLTRNAYQGTRGLREQWKVLIHHPGGRAKKEANPMKQYRCKLCKDRFP